MKIFLKFGGFQNKTDIKTVFFQHMRIIRTLILRIYFQKKIKINHINYPKIPIISPGLTFVQKAFLVGLFSGEINFGGAYYWSEFCVSKWVGLDNKK